MVKPNDLDVRPAGGAQGVVLYVGGDPTTLTLELVDGGDQLVSPEPVGGGARAKLTGLKVGATRLVAEVRGLGTLIIPVEVRERPASDPQPGPEPTQPADPVTQEAGAAAPAAGTAAPKTGSAVPKMGDAPVPWQSIAVARVSAPIALAAGMRIRKRDP